MTALRLVSAAPGTGSHKGEILACSCSEDGSLVLTSGWDHQIRCWDCRTGASLSAIATGGHTVSACAPSPCGRYWLAGTLDGLLTVWDPITHLKVNELLPHTRPITSIAVSPHGDAVATSSFDCRLALYRDVEDLTRHKILKGHQDTVLGCCFFPDGRTLLSWSSDASIRLWDVTSGAGLAPLQGEDRINCAAGSRDGIWVAAGTAGGAIQLWNLEQLELCQMLQLREPLVGCYFLRDDQTVLTVDSSGRISLYSLPKLDPIVEQMTPFAARCCAMSSSSNLVVLGCTTGRPHIVTVEGISSVIAPAAMAVATPDETQPSVLWRLLGRRR